jgi:hypothetical protein
MKQIFFTVAALLLASVAFTPVESYADDHVRAVRVAPPAPRHESIPAARRGFAWAPGFWNWNGRRHVWTKGHWERVRAGYAFHAPAWERADNGWRLNRGGWSRGDRDHDGVPNRIDGHPHNPMRR